MPIFYSISTGISDLYGRVSRITSGTRRESVVTSTIPYEWIHMILSLPCVFLCCFFFLFFFSLIVKCIIVYGQLRKFSENKAWTFMCKRELKRGEMDQRRRKSVWRKCTHELQSFHWLRSHTINLLFVLNLIQELLRLHYWHLYMHIYVMCIFDWKMF